MYCNTWFLSRGINIFVLNDRNLSRKIVLYPYWHKRCQYPKEYINVIKMFILYIDLFFHYTVKVIVNYNGAIINSIIKAYNENLNFK